MKIYNFILSGLIAFIGLSSCNDDLFDIKPADKFTEESVFTNEESLELYVNGCYSGFYTFGLLGWWFYVPTDLFTSPLSDESYAKFEFWEVDPVNQALTLGPSSMACFANKWSESYSSIRNCNVYLKNLPLTKDLDQDFVNRCTDEVKFIRSYVYFDLLSYFGGVPLVKTTADLNNYEDYIVPRNTPEEVVDFIVSEMDDIIKNKALPASYLACDESYKGRVTLAAAYALKAKALLYIASPLFNPNNDIKRWEAAAKANKESIDFAIDNGHDLFPDYSQLIITPFNEEIIFSRSYSSDEFDGGLYRSQLDTYLNSPSNGGWCSLCPTQAQVDSYETTEGKKITDPTSGYKLEKFWENRDPRFYASILYDGAIWKGKEIETFMPGGIDSSDGPVGGWNYSITGYYVRKLIKEDVEQKDYDTREGTMQHKVIFRLGGMYLDYAECLMNIGDENGARSYINKVRDRVSMPKIQDSGNVLKERYINERRVELFLEGHRWFDLRRWNLAHEVLDGFAVKGIDIKKKDDGQKEYQIVNRGTYYFPEHYNLVPIPLTEIEKSRNVLIQNPGY